VSRNDLQPITEAAREHGYSHQHFRWLLSKGRIVGELVDGRICVSRKSIRRFLGLRQEIYGKVRIGPNPRKRAA
jgi:hypothetical protein